MKLNTYFVTNAYKRTKYIFNAVIVSQRLNLSIFTLISFVTLYYRYNNEHGSHCFNDESPTNENFFIYVVQRVTDNRDKDRIFSHPTLFLFIDINLQFLKNIHAHKSSFSPVNRQDARYPSTICFAIFILFIFGIFIFNKRNLTIRAINQYLLQIEHIDLNAPLELDSLLNRLS